MPSYQCSWASVEDELAVADVAEDDDEADEEDDAEAERDSDSGATPLLFEAPREGEASGEGSGEGPPRKGLQERNE